MRKHLFILCAPGSGSTALWKLLQTSPAVSALPHEGQYLNFMTDELRRKLWDPTQEFPWLMVKEEWNKVWNLNKPILLEKSPPNLRRAFEIKKIFDPAYFIVIVRNPYAFCEGTRRRKRGNHSKSYKLTAERWISDTTYQINNIKELKNVIYFTYEQLTEHTSKVTEKILNFIPELEILDTNSDLLIHSISGAVARPIKNLNAPQIARLSMDDIREINGVLKQHPDIMSFFGYEYLEHAYTPIARIRYTAPNLYAKYFTRNVHKLVHRMNRLRSVLIK